MLCTKSPNRLRYAESFDDWGPAFAGASPAPSSADASVLPALRDLSSPLAGATSTPEEWPSGATECECECPWACSSSPPSTRRVFSMMKNDAKPTKMPSLRAGEHGLNAQDRERDETHPMRMLRFSSTMTKCTPPSWCSPMNECGTRCRNTSERRPPVCTFVRITVFSLYVPGMSASAHTAKAVIVLSVLGLISAGMKARMKLGTLYS